MGGNALKEFGVKRVDSATYDRIKKEAMEKLSVICSRLQVPYEMRDKEDYGDVDILAIVKPEFTANLKEWIEATFKPRAIVHNSNVWSFNIEDLQIDLLTTSEDVYDIYFTFLCWGDFSMTMGRISRLYDLKYGIYGLEMPIRDPETNHVIRDLPISKEPRKIFEFMGYDYDRYLKGFTTQEELRNYLFSTPRMHRGFLTAKSENTKHYKRDRKRSMFASWFAWFEEHRMEFPEAAALGIPEDINAKIAYVESVFPESNLRVAYDNVQEEIKNSILSRNKFSGLHIKALFPELEGRAFGALMVLWTNQWPTKLDQIHYILSHDVEHLTELAHKVRKELVFP